MILHKKIHVSHVTTQRIIILWDSSPCFFLLAAFYKLPHFYWEKLNSLLPQGKQAAPHLCGHLGSEGAFPALNQVVFTQETVAALLGAQQRWGTPLIIRYQGNFDWFSSLSVLICCFPYFKHPKAREERQPFSPEEKSVSICVHVNCFSYLFSWKDMAIN